MKQDIALWTTLVTTPGCRKLSNGRLPFPQAHLFHRLRWSAAFALDWNYKGRWRMCVFAVFMLEANWARHWCQQHGKKRKGLSHKSLATQLPDPARVRHRYHGVSIMMGARKAVFAQQFPPLAPSMIGKPTSSPFRSTRPSRLAAAAGGGVSRHRQSQLFIQRQVALVTRACAICGHHRRSEFYVIHRDHHDWRETSRGRRLEF